MCGYRVGSSSHRGRFKNYHRRVNKVVTAVGHGGSIKISGTEEGLKLAAKNVIRLAGDYEVTVLKHGVVSFSHRKRNQRTGQ
ncbi:MAG: hypothetical protein ACJAZ0_001265 [Halioglobus sp.]|jgi:hypothetical protein